MTYFIQKATNLMLSRFFLPFSFIISALIYCPLYANEFYIKTGAAHNQTEYDEVDLGVNLNSESGKANSFMLELGYQTRLWQISVSMAPQKGRLDYLGQTQSGIQKSTKSNISRNHYTLRLSRLISSDKLDWYVLGGLASVKVNRDIRSQADVSGLYEVYNFTTFQLGTEFQLPITDKNKLKFDLLFESALDGEMTVEFKNNQFDIGRVELTNFLAAKLGAEFIHEYSRSVNLSLGVSYKQEFIGKSKEASLYRLGRPAGQFYQPKREYKEISLLAAIKYSF